MRRHVQTCSQQGSLPTLRELLQHLLFYTTKVSKVTSVKSLVLPPKETLLVRVSALSAAFPCFPSSPTLQVGTQPSPEPTSHRLCPHAGQSRAALQKPSQSAGSARSRGQLSHCVMPSRQTVRFSTFCGNLRVAHMGEHVGGTEKLERG